MTQAHEKRLEKTIDKLAQVVSVDEWENEAEFKKRTGFKSPPVLCRWRKENPGGWRVDGKGRYIYSKIAWLKSFQSI